MLRICLAEVCQNSSEHELGRDLQSDVTPAPRTAGPLTHGYVVTAGGSVSEGLLAVLFVTGAAGEALFPAQHKARSLDTQGGF